MMLLRRLEAALAARAIPPSRFGREVFHDPRFVFDLRRGRRPSPDTAARLAAWLQENETCPPRC